MIGALARGALLDVFAVGILALLPLHVARIVGAAETERLYVIDDPAGTRAGEGVS